jgi:hypothetical protein
MRLPSIVAFAFLGLSAATAFHSPISAPAEARSGSTCGAESYINSRGNCVHRPMKANRAPAGASANAGMGRIASVKVAAARAAGTAVWRSG